MIRRKFLTFMASLPVVGLVFDKASACGEQPGVATALEAMQVFVGSLLRNDTYTIFRLVSFEKPFIIDQGKTGSAENALYDGDWPQEMKSADNDQRAVFINDRVTKHISSNSALREIILATGGKDWIEVAPARFAPPGGNADSEVFVSFRPEWDGWYIDAIGYPRPAS